MMRDAADPAAPDRPDESTMEQVNVCSKLVPETDASGTSMEPLVQIIL
jgi:hypothetical protein